MLWEVAAQSGWQVQRFTATPSAPFADHVHTMAETGILVSRHGAMLANALFLPPGAAVYELLPYNWEWRQMSQMYRNMTQSMGMLHHFAWRANDPKWAQYASQDDAKFAPWTADECKSKSALLHCRPLRIVAPAGCQQVRLYLHVRSYSAAIPVYILAQHGEHRGLAS